jgi:hypothetical protein
MFHMREALRQMYTPMELREHFVFDVPGDLHLINLLDPVPGMCQAVCQLSVIGDENEPFAGDVEPADAKHAWRVRRHEIGDTVPTRRVAGRRDDADRFIHGEVHKPRLRQAFAVNTDFVPLRIDARTELGNDFSIDFNAAFEYQLLAFAPAGDSRGSEHFLQTIARVTGRMRLVTRMRESTAQPICNARRRWAAKRRVLSVTMAMRGHARNTHEKAAHAIGGYPMICGALINSQGRNGDPSDARGTKEGSRGRQ